MPDWKKLVAEHLELMPAHAAGADVIAELAAHLEETYEDARSRGLTEAAAIELTLQEIKNWRVLAEDIRRATSEENSMNNRTKTLWLPSLASFALANLCLLALTQISMQPHHLVRLNSGLGRWLYLGWLLTQVLCGAVGAFLSRRAAGTVAARLAAATFPAIVMLGLWVLVIPASAVVEHNGFVFHHPLYYMLGIFACVVPPGIGLLLGAAPFLKERKLHAA
jgi:hypothetical protein